MSILSDGIQGLLGEGIQCAVDAAKETGVEVTNQFIIEWLNKKKWGGSDTWTGKIISSYLDNLRSNVQTSITANIINRRINSIQTDNLGIIGVQKLKGLFSKIRTVN